MKTHQAEYRTDIARLAEDMAKRETRLLLAIAVIVSVAVAVAVAIIKAPVWSGGAPV